MALSALCGERVFMRREILISVDENEVRMALLEDKMLEELKVERREGRECIYSFLSREKPQD